MSEHVPGPWIKANSIASDNLTRITTPDGLEIGAVHSENADLVATAPEVLEMLKEVRRERLVPGSYLDKRVAAVIAKAQGLG